MSNTSNPSDLGQRLRQIRTGQEKTLRDVAEESGKEVSYSYLAQVERGDVNEPSLTTLRALSKVFGLSVTELMTALGLIDERESVPDSSSPREFAILTSAARQLSVEELSAVRKFAEFQIQQRPN